MRMEGAKALALQVGDGPLIELGGANVERDLDSSYLRNLLDAGGNPLQLTPGTTVTLLSEGSVLFVGVVQQDSSVKDLLSCSSVNGDYEDL